LVCTLFALTSCGEDEPKCSYDLAGTYTGTETCIDNFGDPLAESVTVTGTDGNYKVSGTNISSQDLDQTNCNGNYTISALGIESEAVTFTFGEDGSLTYVKSLLGTDVCTFTGSK